MARRFCPVELNTMDTTNSNIMISLKLLESESHVYLYSEGVMQLQVVLSLQLLPCGDA